MKFIRKYWTEIIVLICCIICFVSLKYYISQFGSNGLSNDTDNWGTFGDYVGGVIGTILSFFSIILIYAIYKNQVASSSIQQFETTFFNLLQNQREILKSLKGYVQTDNLFDDYDSDENSADEYISAVATRLYNEFDGRTGKYVDRDGNEIKNVASDKEDNLKIIDRIYDSVYKGKEAELGHYFRHLYHIVKYVNESIIADKKKYIDLIQAQMGDDELYVTFYNGIGRFGRLKFQPLLDQYQFLENIRSRGKIFDLTAKQFYPKTNFKHKTGEK